MAREWLATGIMKGDHRSAEVTVRRFFYIGKVMDVLTLSEEWADRPHLLPTRQIQANVMYEAFKHFKNDAVEATHYIRCWRAVTIQGTSMTNSGKSRELAKVLKDKKKNADQEK